MGMILLVAIIVIICAIAGFVCFVYADENDSVALGITGFLLWIMVFALPMSWGTIHGYVNYTESNDKDKARITAVTQEQDLLRTYYKVEVEYLTNTPTQSGVVTNYNIEKDTFYCYYEDKELVEQLKNNMYKELWLISGHKGGYENYRDFGDRLVKGIELIEED